MDSIMDFSLIVDASSYQLILSINKKVLDLSTDIIKVF